MRVLLLCIAMVTIMSADVDDGEVEFDYTVIDYRDFPNNSLTEVGSTML